MRWGHAWSWQPGADGVLRARQPGRQAEIVRHGAAIGELAQTSGADGKERGRPRQANAACTAWALALDAARLKNTLHVTEKNTRILRGSPGCFPKKSGADSVMMVVRPIIKEPSAPLRCEGIKAVRGQESCSSFAGAGDGAICAASTHSALASIRMHLSAQQTAWKRPAFKLRCHPAERLRSPLKPAQNGVGDTR